MNDCQTCAFKRERPNWTLETVTKYYFGIKHWFFAHQEIECIEDGTKSVYCALPDPISIWNRTEEKCAYYTEAK